MTSRVLTHLLLSAAIGAIVPQVAPQFSHSVAYATEAAPDPGCDGTAGSPMLDTGATITGGKCVFSNVKLMKGVMWVAPQIEAGHSYTVTMDVSGYTGGYGRLAMVDMMTSPSYTALPAVDLNGLAPITNITTMTNGNGVIAGPVADPDSMGSDIMGAFRITCGVGPRQGSDPLVYPGLAGRSHLHQFAGGTSVTPSANYQSIRSPHGGSTCGTAGKLSVNKSLYWQPAMFAGLDRVIVPWEHIIYYKLPPQSSTWCTPGNVDFIGGSGGGCINVPNGLKFIAGYNFGTNTSGPEDDIQGGPHIIKYGCSLKDGVAPVVYSNKLSDLYGGACPIGYIVNVQLTSPDCWDGVNLDSTTHRSHIVIPSVPSFDHDGGGFFRCDDAHPYKIPNIQWSEFWVADADLVAGKWHLSSDEMAVSGMQTAHRGKSMHLDYDEGWEPAAKAEWFTYCINQHASCSAGKLGNGHIIKGDPGKYAEPSFNRYEPLTKFGIGKGITANGTYTFEITAAVSGTLSIVGIEDASGNGFTANVDNIHVVEKTDGRKGPATVTLTGG